MSVKIFGKTVSTPAAAAIAAGSGLAIYFAYKQHKSSKAAAAATTSASAIDPVTGLPYSQDNQTDPLTGMTYLAEAQEYGSVQAAEQAVAGSSALDLSSASGSAGSAYYDGYGAGTDQQGTGYATNAQWAQAVEAGLTDIGYAPTDIAAALGRYLGNLSETPAQATIVQAAIAEYGPPPVGSFQIIQAPAAASTPVSSTVAVPSVIGQTVAAGELAITTAGLTYTLQGGTSDPITAQSPAGGTQVAAGSAVASPGPPRRLRLPRPRRLPVHGDGPQRDRADRRGG